MLLHQAKHLLEAIDHEVDDAKIKMMPTKDTKMKSHTNNFAIVFSLAIAVIVATPASASMIVNLNASTNSLTNPVNVYLQAGTYLVEPIGISDGGAFNAYNAWGSTSCALFTGCEQGIPTQNTGWTNKYNVSASDLTTVTVGAVSLSPVSSLPTNHEPFFYVTPSLRYYDTYKGIVFPNDLTALVNASSSTFTISADENVSFFIRDDFYGDNLGGVSLRLSSAQDQTSVPGPGTLPLFLSFLPSLLIMAHRRKFNKGIRILPCNDGSIV